MEKTKRIANSEKWYVEQQKKSRNHAERQRLVEDERVRQEIHRLRKLLSSMEERYTSPDCIEKVKSKIDRLSLRFVIPWWD